METQIKSVKVWNNVLFKSYYVVWKQKKNAYGSV